MQTSAAEEKKVGLILLLCCITAIILCNTPLKEFYDKILNIPLIFQIGSFKIHKPIHLWVNDGLMAIFFLFVTLEIKKEMLTGNLNTNMKRAFPFVAAVGGIVVPALVYLFYIGDNSILINGWAIPTATDIVFSLSLLAMMTPNANHSARSFLLAVAIFDDVGAILIIAIYYTSNISMASIIASGLAVAMLFILNRLNVKSLAAYLLVGIILWVSVLKSGVHATLAGIGIALALPTTSSNGSSLSERVEDSLAPWVHYFILPIFAFTNSGISFANMSYNQVFSAMPVAIIMGLFFGKLIGIASFSYAGAKLRIAQIPNNLSWKEICGVAKLCGVGFTMSLFIGSLAFEGQTGNYDELVRVGVIIGSVLSAIVAAIYFKYFVYNK